MTITKKYPRKFTFVRSNNPRQRAKDLRNLERNPNLSFELIGFLKSLCSHSEKFNLSPRMLKKGKSKHTIYRLLKQGIEAGYIQRKSILVPHNNHQGYRKDYHYLLAETPIFSQNMLPSFIDKKSVLQCPGLQCTLKPDRLSNKMIKEKKEKKKKPISISKICETTTLGDKPPNPPLSFFLNDQVRIRRDVYDSLIAEYTEPILTMAIDRMNTYIQESGKYLRYECHGAKLRAWLAKDAKNYLAKQEKNRIEEESKRNYAEWLENQESIRVQKEKLAAENEKRLHMRVQKNIPILEKYQKMYPGYITWDKYSLGNGTYNFLGRVEIMSISPQNLEHDLITRINQHEKKKELYRQEAQERTEKTIECDKNGYVVYNIKKQEIQSQIGHSVLNLGQSIQKPSTENTIKSGYYNFKFKNQMNSLLKSYGKYPMAL